MPHPGSPWSLAFSGDPDQQWQERGVPLTLLSFSDKIEVIGAVTGAAFGPHLVANDACEPWVFGDDNGVEHWGSGQSLDEVQEDAASSL